MGIKVISCFDGISCGMVALERAGIKVDEYYASEIDKHAIEVSKKNYPNIKHIGDVTKVKGENLPKIDLLIGGSPCQGLSSSDVYLKDGEYGVNGTGKSRLFWEYVRAFKTIKPKYFLFENVASMRKEDIKIITEQLGVQPVKIDSILFSAQIRRRLYWTNIPINVPLERQTGIKLENILQTELPLDRYYLKEGTVKYILSQGTGGWRSGNLQINPTFSRPVVASCWKMHRADTDTYISTTHQPQNRTNIRKLTPLECERLQTLPDNYTFLGNINSISKLDKIRYECIGNGWTVDVIVHIFKNMDA